MVEKCGRLRFLQTNSYGHTAALQTILQQRLTLQIQTLMWIMRLLKYESIKYKSSL